jgi:hypothetical protein
MPPTRTETTQMTYISRQESHRLLRFPLCWLLGLGLVCTAPCWLSAAEQQPPQRHSLIHRQETDSKIAEPRTPAPTSPSTSTSSSRSLPRKLTKRPGQTTVTAPSTGASTDPLSPPTSTAPVRSDSQPSTGVSAITKQAASSLTTGAVTGSSVPLGAVTPSTTKPASGMAFAGTGPGPAAPSGSSATGGRGIQRLVGDMPTLSQLVAPTPSVTNPQTLSPTTSAPPQSSQVPPPTSPLPPPASSPSPASPAPPPTTGSAILSWTMNSESDLAGYKVYIGTTPGQYNYPGSPVVIGRVSSYTVSGLPAGQTYYFALSAFDNSGAESALSAEVSKSIY